MAKQEVIVGLVGAGFAASLHAESYRKVCGVDVTLKGVAARDPDKVRNFAEKHEIGQVYTSVDELLSDPEINLVDLCVPNSLHEEMIVRAAKAGKHIACEKPLTGFFGDAGQEPVGKTVSRAEMMAGVLRSIDVIKQAVEDAGVKFMYAENWVYAPPVQKANRLLSQSENMILRLVGEESHSGSHTPYAKQWCFSGGGSLYNKGCHPLGAAMYLKCEEGRRKHGKPIRPMSVSAEVANLTHTEAFKSESEKFIKEGWVDCEDWGSMFVTFADGAVAQITAADIVLGGIYNVLRVYSSKAVVECNLNPNTAVVAYAPDEKVFGDEYLREKLETKAGWNFANPDEDWIQGFPDEMQDFCEVVALDKEPLSDLELARDIAVVGYGAYLAAAEGRRVDLQKWL